MHPIYGLIGFPLSHSFSRDYFSRFFADNHIDAAYLNFEIPDIGDIMELLAEYPTLRGFNVTTPYKKQILPYIDSLSPVAAEVGAVNVVCVSGSPAAPQLLGFNTDAPGFAEALKPLLTGRFSTATGALILGSGGAAGAVAVGLKSLGINPVIVSRNPSENQLSYIDITADTLRANPIIINATPLGMAPAVDRCPPFPYRLLSDANLCFDLIYNPSLTEFMRRSASHGATTSDGLQMLLAQARLSWKIWSGQSHRFGKNA